MLRTDPAVFAVGSNYQIITTTKSQAFVSVRVGDRVFVDDSNGILKSASRTHNIEVPQELLDKEKHYTVIEKGIIKRLPYFSKTRADKSYEYDFRPVPENPRAYHIADAHNVVDLPLEAAAAYGDVDFLILNGDIPEDSGNTKNFDTIFDLCAGVTHGNIPVVFSRGNHDLRGNCAELFAAYAPNENGNTYYSFRLGNIWGLVLDCGEDKDDGHAEYGCTVACHGFRQRETEYIKSVIEKAEYDDPGVRNRIIVAHVPFNHKFPDPFGIEEDIYSQWTKLIRENIKPDIMICGHTHRYAFVKPGEIYNTYGDICPIVVGSEVRKKRSDFGGAGFEFTADGINVEYTKADEGSVKKYSV